MTQVTVDIVRCSDVAELLSRIEIPRSEEEAGDLGISADTLPNFCLALVAICHQTSPIDGPRLGGRLDAGAVVYGWDYLRRRLAERIVSGMDFTSVEAWSNASAEGLESALEDADGRRSLTDAAGRAALLHDLGTVCQREGILGLGDICRRASMTVRTTSGDYDIMRALALFSAYRDPVEKKSAFLLELARVECGWQFADPENILAPVDYHEVRGHLRLGTVVISDESLRDRIERRVLVSAQEDIDIRRAVREAIYEISRRRGGADSATLHYLFWNTFRACCQRDVVHCRSCVKCTLPARYRHAFAPIEATRCVFGGVCASADRALKPIEHQHVTDYY